MIARRIKSRVVQALDDQVTVAPDRAEAGFYRAAAGAEIDLVLRLSRGDVWAIEIKRASAPKLDRGCHHAWADLRPAKTYVVYPGAGRFPKPEGVAAIGLREMVAELAARA